MARSRGVLFVWVLIISFLSSHAFPIISSRNSRRISIMAATPESQPTESATASLLTQTMPIPTPANPWYADASIARDRSHVMEQREAKWDSVCHESSRFVLLLSQGMYHQVSNDDNNRPSPVFWTFDEVTQLVGNERLKQSLTSRDKNNLLAWAGEYETHNYWVYYTANVDHDHAASLLAARKKEGDNHSPQQLAVTGLREFGDRLTSSTDAAILATGNGLVEFHKSHLFCSQCGTPTRTSKAGASRTCTSHDCGKSVYPRMDVASIMLITTRCESYALLGRKGNWSPGLYSTLAGFAEVGETMEQCCARETLEESGVAVDRASMRFVCSQPWPFPRSLMVGFRAQAHEAGQPTIRIDESEMEDIRWFHRAYVRDRLDGGSTALSFQPNDQEKEFHIPGPASLGRMLIAQWANEEE